ncbi:MAG: DNA repair exonuclease [Tissierellia bacterium]|nr:DNA repair exonuclease [Tissierellia bacterium]
MKIIHTADLHLGKNYKGEIPIEIADQLEHDIWNTLIDLCKKSNEEKVDLMLIAGDLYERDFFTLSDMNYLMDILGSCNFPVAIAAGNHDYLKEGDLFSQVEIPSNILLFPPKFTAMDLEQCNCRLFGYSYDDVHPTIELNPPKLHAQYKNILLIHGWIQDNPYLTLDPTFLDQFDYVALGHIHKRGQATKKAYYSGSLEPLNFKETGPHGYIELLWEEDLTITYRNFSQKEFIVKTLTLDDENIMEVIESIENQINPNHLYEFILEGRVKDPWFVEELLNRRIKGRYVKFVNHLKPLYSIEALKEEFQGQLLGSYIQTLDQKDEKYQKALQLGLEYLLEAKDEA